ncbi:hypothetical protein N0V90_002247 [Kalmusia sp. IMI 367209]|nr:hypothetical protein N0V90_002247 [Kalmusia sp. IMI 367209]
MTSTTKTSNSTSISLPALPPNVTIFTPKPSSAAQALLNARLFTRLTASASTSPDQLSKALRFHSNIDETFCLKHRNSILIFNGGKESATREDAHHSHFRADADIGLDVAKCVHDAENVLEAGFQLEAMNEESVLVIDLMQAEDEDDSDEDEDDTGV